MMVVAVCALVAAATPGRRVGLTATGCPDGFVAEVRSVLGIELKATVGPLLDAAPERVELSCGAGSVAVTVSGAAAVTPLSVDVSAVEEPLRARTVALVVADAMAQAPPPAVPSPPPAPAPVVPAAPPLDVQPFRGAVSVLGLVRSGAAVHGGAALVVEWAWLQWLGGHADVCFATATVSRAGGAVVSTMVDGAVGLDVRWAAGPVQLRAGPGLRVGGAALEGRPGPERVGGLVTGVMWGPQVSVGASLVPVARLVVSAFVDGGLWAPRLRGEVFGDAPVETAGPVVTAGLGVGWRW
ncbi:MAG: hypothetical protein SFW67_11335 [Myxococcaceae bacterium]|nr:hypothetical protein [Myxococcaceae bacterium]